MQIPGPYTRENPLTVPPSPGGPFDFVFFVNSDNMLPTLREGDFVLIKETKTCEIDGLYLLRSESESGEPCVYRIQRMFGSDRVDVLHDNKVYRGYDLSTPEFRKRCIGRAVGSGRLWG